MAAFQTLTQYQVWEVGVVKSTENGGTWKNALSKTVSNATSFHSGQAQSKYSVAFEAVALLYQFIMSSVKQWIPSAVTVIRAVSLGVFLFTTFSISVSWYSLSSLIVLLGK